MGEQRLPATGKDLNKEMAKAAISLFGMIDQLTPAERTTPGAEGWSVKDHVAHLDAWLRGMVVLLHHENRVDAMGVDMETYLSGDFDRMNEVIRALHADESWETVWERYMVTLDEFTAMIVEMDSADLQRTYSYFQPDEPGEESGAPIVAKLAANSYLHIQEHLTWMHAVVAAGADAPAV